MTTTPCRKGKTHEFAPTADGDQLCVHCGAPERVTPGAPEDVERAKAAATPCKTCGGRGLARWTGTYAGDHEAQHDVCVDCAGTGWADGKAWLVEQSLAKRTRDVEQREKKVAEQEEQTQLALRLSKSLAEREATLYEGEKKLQSLREAEELRIKTAQEHLARAGVINDARLTDLQCLRDAILADVRVLLSREQELLDALTWCGGSADFAPGGKARQGWLRTVAPLLNCPRRTLGAAPSTNAPEPEAEPEEPSPEEGEEVERLTREVARLKRIVRETLE